MECWHLMRHYYSVDAIREAEAPLLASLPDGALMKRAAFGLATKIIGELTARTGEVAGRRVCAVVGAGDNGGDALWAATFLRRRGVATDAILLNPDRAHRKGLAAFRKAGGRFVENVSPATDLVIDGVVGISGSGPLRPAAAEGVTALKEAGGPPGGRRRHPQRHRRGDRGDHRPRCARRAHRHLRWAQTGARACRLRRRRADRYRAQ